MGIAGCRLAWPRTNTGGTGYVLIGLSLIMKMMPKWKEKKTLMREQFF
jgi:hypothetical protein